MTGFDSKRKAAQDKLDDDDTQMYQRPWVGLTYEEWTYYTSYVYAEILNEIEQLLKSKNTWPVSFSQLTLQNFTQTKGKHLFY